MFKDRDRIKHTDSQGSVFLIFKFIDMIDLDVIFI
jgi:hypothetical protein